MLEWTKRETGLSKANLKNYDTHYFKFARRDSNAPSNESLLHSLACNEFKGLEVFIGSK